MIIGEGGPLAQAIYGSQQVKTQLDTLTAAGGQRPCVGQLRRARRRGADAARPAAADRRPDGAQQTAIGSVTGRLSVTQTVLTQINSIATNLNAQLAKLNNVTPSQIDSVSAAIG